MRFIEEYEGKGVNNTLTNATITSGTLTNATLDGPPLESFASTVISTAGNVTYTAAQIITSIARDPSGGNRSDTLPAAAAVITALGIATDGSESRVIRIVNVTDAGETVTIAGGTGNTLIGSGEIGAAGAAEWIFTPLSASTATWARRI